MSHSRKTSIADSSKPAGKRALPGNTSPNQNSTRERVPWLEILAIVVLTIAAYWPAFHAGYIWDDSDHVTQVPFQRTTTALKWVWFKLGTTPQYYPLTHTTFWLEYRLWGMNPLGYHAVNIVLHILCALLVWRVLRMLNIGGAWLVAAIFAVHPVNVESVAWITERKNTLSAFFYLLAMLAGLKAFGISLPLPVRRGRAGVGAEFGLGRKDPHPNPPPAYREREQETAARDDDRVGSALADAGEGALERGRRLEGSPRSASAKADPTNIAIAAWVAYGFCLPFFALAVLSKTVTCTLPAVLVLILWWKFGRVGKRDWLMLLPMLAIALGVAALTSGMEADNVGAKGPEFAFTLGQRVLIAGRAIWFYAGKLLWPHPLVFIYPRWNIDAHAAWQWLFPAGVVVAIAALWILRKRLGRGPMVAVLIFAGTLFPALGFVNVYPMRFSFVADHFQYLASVALIVLAVQLLLKLPIPKNVGRFAAGGLLVLLITLSFRQARVYKDAETLWTDTVAKNPNCWLAMDNLGAEAAGRGDRDAAFAWYDRALAVHPNQQEAHLSRGEMLAGARRFEEAGREFVAAAAIKPNDAKAIHELAKLFVAEGKIPAALQVYEQALEMEPRLEPARMEYANLLRAMNRPADAEAQYQKAIEINPDSFDARSALAGMHYLAGDIGGALQLMSEAIDINPTDPALLNNYGVFLMAAHRPAEAAEEFNSAIAADPTFADAYDGLGNAFIAQGKTREAEKMFRKALELKPDFEAARQHLAGLPTR